MAESHKGRVYENPTLEAIDEYIDAGMYKYARMRIARFREEVASQLNELEKKIEEGEKQQKPKPKPISSSQP